jgi:hypothetical protein
LTHWLHGCGFPVATEGSHIVDGKSAVLFQESAVLATVSHLGDFAVRSIFRRLEVDGRGPVVRRIFSRAELVE